MNVRIYQINMKRDTNNVAFMNYESLPKFQGSSEIDSTNGFFGILSDSTKPHTGLRSSRLSPTGRTKNDKYQENTGQPDRSALA